MTVSIVARKKYSKHNTHDTLIEFDPFQRFNTGFYCVFKHKVNTTGYKERQGKARKNQHYLPVNNCNDGIEVGWGHVINIGSSEEVKGFGLILNDSFGYILDIA